MIYLHTNLDGRIGENLNYLLVLNGMPPKAVATVSPYRYGRGMLSSNYMRHAYSAMDVLMNASCAEGFGLTIIEAQSCGTPVIVTDFSSMPELVRAGWKVGYSDKRYYQESYQVAPSVPDLVEALEQAYQKRGDQTLREQARAGMLADYDADVVTEQWWKPALELIEKEVHEGAQTQQSQRAARTAQRVALRNKPEQISGATVDGDVLPPVAEVKTDPEVANVSA
jgi:glycosyltransferase involved in cell wall biosynthesis